MANGKKKDALPKGAHVWGGGGVLGAHSAAPSRRVPLAQRDLPPGARIWGGGGSARPQNWRASLAKTQARVKQLEAAKARGLARTAAGGHDTRAWEGNLRVAKAYEKKLMAGKKQPMAGNGNGTKNGNGNGTKNGTSTTRITGATPPMADLRFIGEAKAGAKRGSRFDPTTPKRTMPTRTTGVTPPSADLRFFREAAAGAKRGSQFDRPARPSVFASTGGPIYPLTTKSGTRSRRGYQYGKAGIPKWL